MDFNYLSQISDVSFATLVWLSKRRKKMEEKFLDAVYGYCGIKKELKQIHDWYLNPENLGKRKSLLPKGILLYGEPGEGKTHPLREYSKTFGFPVFVIEGDSENVLEEVTKTYEKASKEERAIVVIDEIDGLIEKDTKLTRILMTKLDGYQVSNILTLAALNNIYSFPKALLREGRFDRQIQVFLKDKEDVLEVIKGFAQDASLSLSENEMAELLEVFHHWTPSAIRAVLNDASLRYGKEATIDQIIHTADFIDTGIAQDPKEVNVPFYAAVHEAGHAIYTYLFCPNRKFLRIYFSDSMGKTVCSEITQRETREGRIGFIRTCLAGMVAEELLLKKHEVGCSNDLERAYQMCFRLVNRTRIKDVKHFCIEEGFYVKTCNSEYLNRIFDKEASSFLRQNYKAAKKSLKKYRREILQLAYYLMEHKEIKREEFLELMKE